MRRTIKNAHRRRRERVGKIGLRLLLAGLASVVVGGGIKTLNASACSAPSLAWETVGDGFLMIALVLIGAGALALIGYFLLDVAAAKRGWG